LLLLLLCTAAGSGPVASRLAVFVFSLDFGCDLVSSFSFAGQRPSDFLGTLERASPKLLKILAQWGIVERTALPWRAFWW
jgi:hypothetical protein